MNVSDIVSLEYKDCLKKEKKSGSHSQEPMALWGPTQVSKQIMKSWFKKPPVLGDVMGSHP